MDATCRVGLVEPFDKSADIVTYVLTKWYGGPLLSFSLKDHRMGKAQQFISALKLITHAVLIWGALIDASS